MSTINSTSFSRWNSFWGNQIKIRQAMALNQWSNPLSSLLSGGFSPYSSVMEGINNQGFMNPALMQLAPALVMAALAKIAQQSQQLQGVSGSQSQGSVDDGMKTFGTIDTNEDGRFDYSEYEQYYIRDKENLAGKTFDNPNSPELAKYKQEAKNLFSAISRGNETVSKDDFKNALIAFDRLDGEKDGNIDNNLMAGIVNKIKENGEDTIISNGKTLRELM